jgi:diguanylate cyclase (GGDEF)-like protein
MDRFDEMTKQALIFDVLCSILIIILVLFLGYSAFSPYEKNLKNMAMIDPLSNALNRRAFNRFYQDALSSIHRSLYPRFSIVLVDIDKFKNVNDIYGHLAGDKVIKGIADTLHAMLRKSDVVCRWGGEEFMLLLPNCHILKAEIVAEKIRVAIENEVFSVNGKNIKTTISAGVIDFKIGDDPDILIEKVDQALYKAKESGRNKVVLAEK